MQHSNYFRRLTALAISGALSLSLLAGCGGGTDAGADSAASGGAAAASDEQVIMYTNADDEAIAAMQNALDANGFEGQYMVQVFGTSELGGKLLAEGANLEADLVTMSSYYLDSAQAQNNMFLDLAFEPKTLEEFPSFYSPITAQEGAIIVNTEVLAENNLPMPTCLKDLANPVYKDMISVTDINSSSTAWLLVQAIVDAYGTGDEGKEILTGIFKNAGPHIESSGSAPLKKCRAGEVAVGFGLRHQAVADKEEGLPIDYVDPTEGNFRLTESVAVLDKGDKTNEKAMEMAQCIVEKARAELIQTYPNALYEGEKATSATKSAYPKVFPEKLTVELLKEHTAFSDACKQAAQG
ncbi:MAG: ABC transporter substrate-binding protein [Butyricicoccus sp.]|nr:ABC transporter substrate-binding protein [Butyricicoccus sp.]